MSFIRKGFEKLCVTVEENFVRVIYLKVVIKNLIFRCIHLMIFLLTLFRRQRIGKRIEHKRKVLEFYVIKGYTRVIKEGSLLVKRPTGSFGVLHP